VIGHVFYARVLNELLLKALMDPDWCMWDTVGSPHLHIRGLN